MSNDIDTLLQVGKFSTSAIVVRGNVFDQQNNAKKIRVDYHKIWRIYSVSRLWTKVVCSLVTKLC